MVPGMISIIIPVLNEVKDLPALLDSLKKQDEDFELIFIDGGSTDGSLGLLEMGNHICIRSERKGRAAQMNLGAHMAKGEILFFLHADSQLENNVLSKIKKSLLTNNFSAGSFVMQLHPTGFLYNLYNWCTSLNSIFFTYGDAGLFMKKNTFLAIEGYPDIPIMEDVAIQKKLRRAGKFIKLKTPIRTSSRRFQKNGSILQILIDICIITAWHLNVNPRFLKRLYPDKHR